MSTDRFLFQICISDKHAGFVVGLYILQLSPLYESLKWVSFPCARFYIGKMGIMTLTSFCALKVLLRNII